MSTTTAPPPAPIAPVHKSAGNDGDRYASFHVPWSEHLLSGVVATLPRLWKRLGNLETFALQQELADIRIERPVYIAGIARSGSTILLEAIAAHRCVGTHQYRDFPGLMTPVWWNRALSRQPVSPPVERAHGDGLMITPESPEALEEVLWMAYFNHLHDPDVSNVLGRDIDRADFARFYTEHLRKLLLVRGASRYASKGNYNFTRLAYLQSLFADARFLVTIRHPVHHIASLMKQHRLFVEGERRHPRALVRMQRVGHFEFGLDRRAINVGNAETIEEIESLWENGDDVRGWARYWAHLYGWMADQLKDDRQLAEAVRVVRFEDMCDDAAGELEQIRLHCELNADANMEAFAGQIHAPTYYRPDFTDRELEVIHDETAATAARYGYGEEVGIRN
ncbi:hypothetical protein Mal4_58570 [Maioricimonas rarisocia]|uniref:Sulfotransferase domain protein n=1 Tax=Maioricimonas rarisocia TaxID=2528026 RepID=A0A517ZGC0_9PLAN|nr:sulfotransferase [Maioricimonas rarisocia]QDU41489.1 hypothetical protein Mal4_58570 [Maioricimonas rarisocia]